MALSQTRIHAEIGLLITRIGRLWRREADQALAAHGLSEATAIPLIVLLRRGKSARQCVLAEEVGIEGPSLVRLVDLLQAEGLVEGREDPEERRGEKLHPTAVRRAEGAQVCAHIARVLA